MLGLSSGEDFLKVRTQKIPYLTNAEENELKRLMTTTDEGYFAMKNFGPQKAREVPLLGIGMKREWWDSGSNSRIS
jgi:hypothetical protein